MFHTGDTNTKIEFDTNKIDLKIAGASRLYTTNYGVYVQAGLALAFLATNGGATPNMKSGGTNNQDLLFTTGSGNPTRLQIDSTGDLTLGGGKIYGEDNAANSLHLQSTSGNNNHSRIEIGASQSSDNGGIHFYTAGSSTATRHMTLKGTSGHLGIGVDNPSVKLHVDVGAPSSANKIIGRFQAESSRRLDIVWHDSGSLMGFDTPSSHSYIFKIGGSEKLRIVAAGIDVTGTITMDAVPGTNTNSALPVLFQTSAGVIDGGSQLTYNPGGDVLKVNGLTLSTSQIRTGGSNALQLTTANANGTVDLYVRTTHVECNGDFLPQTDNDDDLGSSSKRWANIYSADLQLSNVGTGGNEVDGTEGKWTLQEAEDTVYMINRINGKRYKIKMEEV